MLAMAWRGKIMPCLTAVVLQAGHYASSGAAQRIALAAGNVVKVRLHIALAIKNAPIILLHLFQRMFRVANNIDLCLSHWMNKRLDNTKHCLQSPRRVDNIHLPQ